MFHTKPLTRTAVLFAGLGLVLIVASCSRDPAVAKKKHFEQGQRYLKEGKFQEASLEFRNALQIDPKDAEAHYNLGLAYLELGHWREAYKAFSTTAELQSSHPGARLHLADLLLAENRAEEARQEIQLLLAADPENLQGEILWAKSYLVEKDFQAAVAEFKKLHEKYPQNPVILSALGLGRVGAGQFAEAEKDFRRVIEIAPDSEDAYRNLANLYWMTNRGERVEPLLQRALAANPKSTNLPLILADFYYREGRRPEIEKLFARLKSQQPEAADLEIALGDFWLLRNELDRAVHEYEAAAARRASLLVGQKLVSAYLTLGRISEAKALNEMILKEAPQDSQARAFRGALAYFEGNYTEATRELQAVLKADPRSVFASYYLGRTFMATGQPDQARTAFMECIRWQEGFFQAYEHLAEIALQKADGKVAAEYGRKLTELNPRAINGYLVLAQALMQENDLRGAEAALRQAKDLGEEPAEVYELTARLYALQDRPAAAAAQYEEALRRSPKPFPTLTRYSFFLVSRGQTGEAIKRLREWMSGRPERPEYYELLARLCLETRDLGEAETAAWKAERLEPRGWGAPWLLGRVYQERGQLEKALAHYDESIRRRPRSVAPYVSAGNFLRERGLYENATRYFEEALRFYPDSREAKLGLVYCYLYQQRNLLVALGIAQDLKRSFPKDPEVAHALGWLYHQQGRHALALDQLEFAARQQPENALFQFHLGLTYYQTGRKDLARPALERATKLGLAEPALAEMARRTLSQLGGG